MTPEFFFAIVLTKTSPSGTTISLSSGYVEAVNRDAAKGQAVDRAMAECPGHAVAMINIHEV